MVIFVCAHKFTCYFDFIILCSLIYLGMMDQQSTTFRPKYSILVPTYCERLNISLLVYLLFKELK